MRPRARGIRGLLLIGRRWVVGCTGCGCVSRRRFVYYYSRAPIEAFEGLEPHEVKVSRAVRRGLGRAIAPGYPVLHIKYYRRCRPFLRNCSLSTNYSVVTWRCTTLSLNSHGESCCQSLAFSNRFRTIGTRQSLLLLPVHLRNGRHRGL